MADDQAQLREAAKVLKDLEAPDAVEQAATPLAQPVPDNAVVNPAASPAPPVDPSQVEGMVAPMDPLTRIRQTIPNFGLRQTDPEQALKSVAAADAKTQQAFGVSAGQQLQGAELAGQAGQTDAAANLQGAQDTLTAQQAYNQQLNENQAQQQSLQTQAEAELRDNIENHKKLYAKDPTRWWANANSGAKISGILGILGAGMQGKDSHKFLTDLIDRDTATLDRQEANLDKLGLSKEKLGRFKQSGVAARLNNLQSRHVAALDLVKDQIDAKLATTGDQKARASLLAARGKILEDQAVKVSGLVHQRIGEKIALGGQADHQDDMLMKQKIAEDAAFAKAHAAGKTGQIKNNPGWTSGVYSQMAPEVTKFVGARQTMIENLDKMIEYSKDPTPENLLKMSNLQAAMMPDSRGYTQSGANLTGAEAGNMAKLQGTVAQAVAGGAVGLPLAEQLAEVQEVLAQSARVHLNQVTPSPSEPMPGTRFYDILHAADQKKEAAKHYAEEFNKVLDSKELSGVQKLAEIRLLAKKGNTLAIQHVRKMSGHGGVIGTMMGLN